MTVYSRKYLLFILSTLVAIMAVIFGVSQYYVSMNTPESETEYNEHTEDIVPYSKGPTTPPMVSPPLAPPPQQ